MPCRSGSASKLATDGEFRRRSYHSFFYQQLGDVSIDTVAGADAKATGASGRAAQPVAMVQQPRPVDPSDHGRGFRIPRRAHHGAAEDHDPWSLRAAFPRRRCGRYRARLSRCRSFWSDTVEAFRKELIALYDAGCRYVQIDETAFAKFGDPDVQASLKARGDDWDD